MKRDVPYIVMSREVNRTQKSNPVKGSFFFFKLRLKLYIHIRIKKLLKLSDFLTCWRSLSSQQQETFELFSENQDVYLNPNPMS